MTYQHLIFDLDGTLLDTISDIARAITDALHQCGYSRSYDKITCKALIGDGADALLHRALNGLSDTEEEFLRLKKAYLPLYKAYQGVASDPFEGMAETLKMLGDSGVDFSIVTNKPDQLAKIIMTEKMPTIQFVSIEGHQEGNPVKPNPFQILRLLESKKWEKTDCLFIGDSHVDIDTARNAGLKVALCTWGYDRYEEALLSRADHILNKPSDLLDLVK